MFIGAAISLLALWVPKQVGAPSCVAAVPSSLGSPYITSAGVMRALPERRLLAMELNAKEQMRLSSNVQLQGRLSA